MAHSAAYYLKQALNHERALRKEKVTDKPTSPIQLQSDAGIVEIKNTRGASWNALRDEAHKITCTSFLQAAKALQGYADQNLTVAGDHPVQAATTSRASDDNVGLDGNMSFTPRQFQEMIAAGVQQGLARTAPQPLALTNGVHDTLQKGITALSDKTDGILNLAAEAMIDADEDQVLEKAAELYLADTQNLEDIKEKALEDFVEKNDIEELALEKEAVEVDYDDAVDRYIENNEERVHDDAVEQHIKCDAEHVHDDAVDRYIETNSEHVLSSAVDKYLKDRELRAEVRKAAKRARKSV